MYFTIHDASTGKVYENSFSLEIGIPKKSKDGKVYTRDEAIDISAMVANSVATTTTFVATFIGTAGRTMTLSNSTLPYLFAAQMQLKINKYFEGATVTANTYGYPIKESPAVYVNIFKGILERID